MKRLKGVAAVTLTLAAVCPVGARGEDGPPHAADGEDQAFDFGEATPSGLAKRPPDGADAGEDQGFDFGGSGPPPAASEPHVPAGLATVSLAGFLRSDVGFWVERLSDEPLAKARQSLDLVGSWRRGPFSAGLAVHGEHDLATHVDPSRFDAATIAAYRGLVDLRRAWLGVELGEVELRLPALMTRAGWYRGAHRVEILWIHQGFYGYRTPPLGPFSPLPGILARETGLDVATLLAGRALRWEHRPERFAWAAQQWLGRWAWRGAGLDLALLGGLALDQQGTVGLPDASALAATDIALPLRHLRYGLLATTGAAPLGDWVLRWELALGLDRPFNVATPDAGPVAAIGTARHDTVGGVLGLSWAGLPDTLVALEVAETVPLGAGGSDFLVPPDLPQVMLRVTHRALRDSLRLLAVVTGFGLAGELGWLGRLDAGWAAQDGLEVGLGYMRYEPTDRAGPLTGLDRHDRVSLRVRWDFNLLGSR
jgi:hypothetical protein